MLRLLQRHCSVALLHSHQQHNNSNNNKFLAPFRRPKPQVHRLSSHRLRSISWRQRIPRGTRKLGAHSARRAVLKRNKQGRGKGNLPALCFSRVCLSMVSEVNRRQDLVLLRRLSSKGRLPSHRLRLALQASSRTKAFPRTQALRHRPLHSFSAPRKIWPKHSKTRREILREH